MNLQEMIRERDELNRRIRAEENAIRDNRYTLNIVNLSITLDQVERHDDNKPWFGHIDKFNEWCDKNSDKRFRSWCGSVYLAGTGIYETLCTIDDLKKRK